MGLFGKKKDVVDLTELQKSGVLQRSQEVEKKLGEYSKNENNVVDLSGFARKQTNVESVSSGGTGEFGFLGNLAGAGNTETSSTGDYGSYTEKLKVARAGKLAEFNHMKVKLEDLEYKLERLIERLERIENRLLNIG
ncbi:MAG: hypothetical protein AABX59_03125 [Nanoarchaeota archaeon]